MRAHTVPLLPHTGGEVEKTLDEHDDILIGEGTREDVLRDAATARTSSAIHRAKPVSTTTGPAARASADGRSGSARYHRVLPHHIGKGS
ncbi:hypothetical protein [Rhodococcus yananensis]|uniref:hypothetical protein n=1 Tax=Rhodococcus yananensis TaxID=2879464 RepID=UPI003EBC8984